ncbi:NusG domain II-containing protein [Desnuesiella massiliensis]|uniref:NusG domain II-containing protein n=1 Tax=Desnuesiella massiliensis TaxID=1650662 RepID=UPI0006E29E1E|nr:NusG domain II-containing protein [Desnuesiella massiliensis]
MIKKWDIIIVVALLVLSFIPEVVFGIVSKKNYDAVYAEVSVNGKLHKKIRIDNHKGTDNYTVKNEYGINVIQVKDNKVAIIEADCPDKVCEKPGFIQKPGETLVCLPHRLVVEIKGNSIDQDETIISY